MPQISFQEFALVECLLVFKMPGISRMPGILEKMPCIVEQMPGILEKMPGILEVMPPIFQKCLTLLRKCLKENALHSLVRKREAFIILRYKMPPILCLKKNAGHFMPQGKCRAFSQTTGTLPHLCRSIANKKMWSQSEQ